MNDQNQVMETIDNQSAGHSRQHWSVALADRVLEQFPDMDRYTAAAGISPSGVVHFGNFRDIVTAYAVHEELLKRGKKSRMIFSWDDFDRLRKVPAGVPEDFEQYIGMPLSKVPSPVKGFSNYAEAMEKQFEAAMAAMGFEIEFKYQTELHEAGTYDEQFIFAMQRREEIAKILLSFMTEKGKENKSIDEARYIENYYPLTVYSRFSGKDNTKILSYDGQSTITYKCFDSDKEETIDFTKEHIVKLGWKPDWAMRWQYEGVTFEPGGADHAAPGGSYETSSAMSRDVFGGVPPVFQGYQFVGIQGLGSKMSGSKGNSISPGELLEIYTPELLKWLYYRAEPLKVFQLAFDTEVYRVYAEFDEHVAAVRAGEEGTTEYDQTALALSGVDMSAAPSAAPIPLRQAVAFGQIASWDVEKVRLMLKANELEADEATLPERLAKAKAWLETYNEDEMIQLRASANTEFAATLTDVEKGWVQKLHAGLAAAPDASIEDLTTLVYDVVKEDLSEADQNDPKALGKAQRQFFKIIYNLLINQNAGPRLATYLWSIEDKEQLLQLLNI